jgi:tetratricopeptide (TPR) repeat protein
VRPPFNAAPLWWHRIVEGLASSYGLQGAIDIIIGSGTIALGILTVIVYFLFYAWMPIPSSVQDEWWSRIVSAAGAVLFALSTPVWRVTRVFSPDVLNLILFAFLLLILSNTFYAWLKRVELDALGEEVPLSNKIWKYSPLCLLVGFVFIAIPDVLFYSRHGGIESGFGDLFVQFVRSCFHFLASGFQSLADFGSFLVFALIPLAFVFARLFVSYDNERPFSVADILLFAVVFCMSVLQLGSFNGLEFSRLGANHISEMSSFFACAGTLFAAFTATIAMRVFVLRMPKKAFQIALPALFVPGVMMTHLFSNRSVENEVSKIVNDAIVATVEECKDCEIIVTDGSLDAAIEVSSLLRGRKIKALSMMSGKTDYEKQMRLRGEQVKDDTNPLVRSTAEALKSWVEKSNPILKTTAVQMGFELWREKNLKNLVFGGFCARTINLPEKEITKFSNNAVNIGERIIELSQRAESFDFLPLNLRLKFAFVQWRISRLARMRATSFDIARDNKNAEKYNLLADKLDEVNEEFQRLKGKSELSSPHTDVVLTPEEGLSIGLSRADFAFARKYALQVLNSEPENTRANFAVAMDYFVKHQYSRAEKHFLVCLKMSPNQAAVLNNLAITQYRLGKFDEAEKNAVKACEYVPNSFEAKETLRQIRKALKTNRQKKVK